MDYKYLTNKETMEEMAKKFLPFMILQIADEDLEKLEKDYPERNQADKILITMLLNPKEKWKELGVPEYLLKYEIENEENEDY